MPDMIRYIFSSLNDTETMTLHLILQEMEIRSINRDLESLKKEIKELKKTEGD